MKRIPQDHNYRTACPAAIRAKITALEHAAMDYAFKGAAHPADVDALTEAAQVARYNLERTILTFLERGKNAEEHDQGERAQVQGEILVPIYSLKDRGWRSFSVDAVVEIR